MVRTRLGNNHVLIMWVEYLLKKLTHQSYKMSRPTIIALPGLI